MRWAEHTLAVGDRAPAFDRACLDGTTVRMPPDRLTLLSFLRYAACPMCNLRVRELTHATAELESCGMTWVAVFHSPAERLERRFNENVHGHIIPDPKRELYALYGIERSWWRLAASAVLPSFYWHLARATVLGFWGGAIDVSYHSMPADFLVAPDGVIRQVHYGKHIGDHVAPHSLMALR